MLPIISVVLPVYNGELYINRAIESILNQTFTNFEFIIINDGSTDNSLNIIYSYNDKRILVYNQEQKGVASTLKYIIPKCKGKYIARMDQDDISYPNRLQIQYDYLLLHNVSVVSNSVDFIDKDDNFLGRSFPPTNEYAIYYSLLNEGCVINHPSVMFKKSDYLQTEGYCTEVGDIFTDYYLWIQMINKGFKVHNLNVILLKYRLLANSLSTKFLLDSYDTKCLFNIIKSNDFSFENKSKIKSLYYNAKSNISNNYKRRKSNATKITNKIFIILKFIFGDIIATNIIFLLKNNIIKFKAHLN